MSVGARVRVYVLMNAWVCSDFELSFLSSILCDKHSSAIIAFCVQEGRSVFDIMVIYTTLLPIPIDRQV